MKIGGSGSGMFPTAAVISRGVCDPGAVSVEFKAGDGFSFGIFGGLCSYISFTWSSATSFKDPASLNDVGNYASANFHTSRARSLSVVFNGRSGTVSESALIVYRDGAGGEKLWSVPCAVDLSRLTDLRITTDSWQGLGLLITVNDLQITAEGTSYPPIDLGELKSAGPGTLTAAVCGGRESYAALTLCSVCGSPAASFAGTGEDFKVDSEGVIIQREGTDTTEPAPVTTKPGDHPGTDNPDSGDEGLVIALACLAASGIIAVIIVKRKK